jgi:hypothetical protein
MNLKTGQTLMSALDETAVIVVRAPAGDHEVTCGRVPMRDSKSGEAHAVRATAAAEPGGAGAQLGKRYVDAGQTVELVCAKAGSYPLALDGEPLIIKAAKPLPASD